MRTFASDGLQVTTATLQLTARGLPLLADDPIGVRADVDVRAEGRSLGDASQDIPSEMPVSRAGSCLYEPGDAEVPTHPASERVPWVECWNSVLRTTGPVLRRENALESGLPRVWDLLEPVTLALCADCAFPSRVE